MLDRLLAELGPYQLAECARAALLAHRWPGNLREMSNVLRYATALCDAPEGDASAWHIELQHLPDALQAPPPPAFARAEQATKPGAAEAANPPSHASEELAQLLAQCQGNVSEVARLLGVNRSTVHRRIQRMLGQRQVRWDGQD